MNEKQFVENWINKIQSEGLRNFPLSFIDLDKLEVISIPIKTLIIGQEFFGAYELITTSGEQIYQAANYDEAKFFVYSSRLRNGKTYLPKDKSLIKNLVKNYEEYLDNLLIQIKVDYNNHFLDGKNLNIILNEIFQKLNLVRY